MEATTTEAKGYIKTLAEVLSRRMIYRSLLYRHPLRTGFVKTKNPGGVWTVNSPQSHIVRVYDAGHGKSGVFHSAEWHDGDWSSDGIREAYTRAFGDGPRNFEPWSRLFTINRILMKPPSAKISSTMKETGSEAKVNGLASCRVGEEIIVLRQKTSIRGRTDQNSS
ncbi:hypothetical protein TNCV_1164081 [Trichonephila clavipes]|nr:hypothetical protein TNCV_1164081 [Trichonephila clavipes]